MRREELRNLCRAVESGETRLVQNEDLFYTGRVTACHGDQLTVEAFGHSFEWDSGHCREVDERVDSLGPPSNE
ncbi:MAG: hypothetical protein FIB02_04000 [Desulfuromonas sp.]|nr:hypothetical protein [Desulfuromonas sp.]